MLESTIAFLTSIDPRLLYAALGVSAFLENVLPPVPGDSVVVAGAYLAARAHLPYLGVVLATTVGSEAGFMTYYFLGRLLDPARFTAAGHRFIPAGSIERAHAWFERRGLWVVFLNRFCSGIRSVISLVAGITRLPWLRVLLLSTLGCLLWNALLVGGGYLLGSNWRSIGRIFATYNQVLLVVAAVAVTAWLVRRRMRRTAEQPEGPKRGE